MLRKAARGSCELANPAQVRQIASQTEDLLRRMRFVAGRGRCGGEPSGRCCWPKRCGRDGAKWKSERKSLPLRRRRCNAAGAQKTLQCSRCTEAAAMQQMRRRRCDAADAQKPLRCSRCTEADPLGARKKRRASTDRWHRKSNPAQRLVTPMPAAQEK